MRTVVAVAVIAVASDRATLIPVATYVVSLVPAVIAVDIWADAVRDADKVPFYIYSADNIASRALLRSLGGREFAKVVAYA